jgi:plastocyanin
MRKLLILPILLVAVLLVGVGPAAAKTRSIKIGDDFFVRPSGVPTVTVKKGTTAKWRWTGRDAHNVVGSGPASFQSAVKSSGTFKRKMKKKGTYRIVCTIHSGMRMTLKVK